MANKVKVFLSEDYQFINTEEGMNLGNYQCMWKQ